MSLFRGWKLHWPTLYIYGKSSLLNFENSFYMLILLATTISFQAKNNPFPWILAWSTEFKFVWAFSTFNQTSQWKYDVMLFNRAQLKKIMHSIFRFHQRYESWADFRVGPELLNWIIYKHSRRTLVFSYQDSGHY